MDARHETLIQQVSNEIIKLMNGYIQENTDEILSQHDLYENMKSLAKCLYEHADMRVDIDGILSKRNFLSTDTVFLPYIEEAIFAQQNNNTEGYRQFIEHIKKHVTHSMDEKDGEFYGKISHILSHYRI